MVTQQTSYFIKKVKTYGEFSEIIEGMFDWNIMGTLSDGVQVYYVDDCDHENVKGDEQHVRENEIVSNEEIIMEEEEVIEMSGVNFYEGCYDLGMKFIKVDYGVYGENAQNHCERFSSDDHEKESWKLDARKDGEHKQLKRRIQELNDQLGI
ncbi:13957_t:CDS:2 [Funneliformis mosseae]|uniref:13957_t:CDS:1 n=1 Tax=Funneliformis mosseae TaxID=27381 RepID=A0A9N8YT96_FUNMO|nr:13957_t:CDS:2 [Funneliformis mosseae]